MFFNKKARAMDKEILKSKSIVNENSSTIELKINSSEQIFSSYSYSGDKLNPEFCDYIFNKAKFVSLGNELSIRIHTKENLDASEVEKTLKSHYSEEYKDTKTEIKRVTKISVIMTILGIIALSLFILVSKLWNNFYATTIIEIASWVFIWEAVDYFFLERPKIKAKCFIIQQIYNAKIEISKD